MVRLWIISYAIIGHMLDRKFVEENPDLVREKMKDRGMNVDISGFLKISEKKKTYLSQIENLRHELNTNSKEIGRLKKEGEDASQLINEMKQVSSRIKELESEYKEFDEQLLLHFLENLLLKRPYLLQIVLKIRKGLRTKFHRFVLCRNGH